MKKLMKTFWPMVLALIPFNSIAAQEVQHAPTVAQCRADQRLWLSRLESQTEIDTAGFLDLAGWSKEMGDSW